MNNISWWYELIVAILTGTTQGLTEFIPVSSTAHMRLVSGFLLGGKDFGLAASNFIQLGTMVSILYYFRTDLTLYVQRAISIIQNPKLLNEYRENIRLWIANKPVTTLNGETDITIAQLIIGTLPIIFVAILFRDITDDVRSYSVIATMLIFGSAFMWFAEYFNTISSKVRKPTHHGYTLAEVILIGFFQSLAIFPGISRSGATLSGAFMLGHDREKAVKFAFLLSIPSITLGGIIGLVEIINTSMSTGLLLSPMDRMITGDNINFSVVSLISAFFFAVLFGYITLKWLMNYLKTNSFNIFIFYRVILGLVIYLLTFLNIV